MPTRRLRIAALLLTIGCAPRGGDNITPDPTALAAITADRIMGYVRTLSSDAFEGRGPGTRGEDTTVAYLTAEFKRMGLAPGNPDGSYVQNVGMVGFSTTSSTTTFKVRGRSLAMKNIQDIVNVARHDASTVSAANSDVVFVGYGIVAPEYGWDDYKGVDVKGKTILMLINDPPVPGAGDSTRLDDAVFKGRAMTYYGRWTYKYEIASQKGAAAAIIIHETGPAGYPFAVLQNGGERLDIDPPDSSRVRIESWMSLDKTKELFKAAGHDFDALKRQAMTKEFTPVSLGATASITVNNAVRRLQSRNVIAKLEGSDPVLKDEYVIYTAHWDHFGRDTTLAGDQIFNGALDNASGTAVLLSLGDAFTALPQKPKRSILFLAVTAEERGLLGAKYYAERPLYPLAKTVANINEDGANTFGPTRDIVILGLGNSTLDDEVTAVATTRGRRVAPDPEPEKGYFYRSDQFEFAKQGVPVLYTDTGIDYIGQDSTYGIRKREEYVANDYHKVSDEIKPDWTFGGAAEDTQLLFEVGFRVAQKATWPEWKAGAEFKAKRDAMLKK